MGAAAWPGSRSRPPSRPAPQGERGYWAQEPKLLRQETIQASFTSPLITREYISEREERVAAAATDVRQAGGPLTGHCIARLVVA